MQTIEVDFIDNASETRIFIARLYDQDGWRVGTRTGYGSTPEMAINDLCHVLGIADKSQYKIDIYGHQDESNQGE